MTRFVVRECEGNRGLTHGGGGERMGLSVVVLDSAINYRRVEEFRTEDVYSKPHKQRRETVREQARVLADRLNQQVTA